MYFKFVISYKFYYFYISFFNSYYKEFSTFKFLYNNRNLGIKKMIAKLSFFYYLSPFLYELPKAAGALELLTNNTNTINVTI